MNESAKGRTIVEGERRIEPVKLEELALAIGTETAAESSRLVPFFGPTIAGDQRLVEVLDLDLSRALLAGQAWEWERPFVSGETVGVHLYVEDVFAKGDNTFAVVVSEFRGTDGELIQTQRTTFIERGGK